jgi:hypothetical protein
MPLPNLPAVVEILASLVMLVSVVGAFWSLRITHNKGKTPIGPRHIQFVSVCLIVPTILILGLEKVLSSETSATLIGGLAGYLLSGIGKYEPPKPRESSSPSPEAAPPKPASSGQPSQPNTMTANPGTTTNPHGEPSVATPSATWGWATPEREEEKDTPGESSGLASS